MTEKVVRIYDAERRSRDADAVGPRDPCEADLIVMPRGRELIPVDVPVRMTPVTSRVRENQG